MIPPPKDLFLFANELRSFGVEIEPLASLSTSPKLHLIEQLRVAMDTGKISATELIFYLRDLEKIPSPSVQEEEYLKGMRYHDLLRDTLEAYRASNSPTKTYVCERCGEPFDAPSDLVDPYLGEEGYELCDRCLSILFDDYSH